MPTLEVKCTVANCFYHAIGDVCGAEKIEIHADSRSNQNNNAEFSSDFDAHVSKKEAAHSKDTCCKTFIPKK